MLNSGLLNIYKFKHCILCNDVFCSDPFDPAVIELMKRQKEGIATKNLKIDFK